MAALVQLNPLPDFLVPGVFFPFLLDVIPGTIAMPGHKHSIPGGAWGGTIFMYY
jgi:hypothetical protein